jgi:hypothetical protein
MKRRAFISLLGGAAAHAGRTVMCYRFGAIQERATEIACGAGVDARSGWKVEP